MAVRELIQKPENAVERNVALTGEVTRYLLENPSVLELLPEKFQLVVLPEDDPELLHYNLQLMIDVESEGDPVIFVRLRTGQMDCPNPVAPEIYVPLAATM